MRSGCAVSAAGASESLASVRAGAELGSVRLERSLGRRGSIVSVELGSQARDSRFDRLPAFSRAWSLGFRLARAPRRARVRAPRAGVGSIVFRKLCRHVGLGHSGGLDLLAQHAKAAIAQKFALTAEHRRGGQRDQPAPIKPGERPFDSDAGKRFARSPSTRMSSSPRSNPTRRKRASIELAAIGRVGPDRGDKHGMRRAKAALLVEGPQEARIRRRRTGHMRRRLFAQIRRRASLPAAELRGSRRVRAARRLRRPEPEPTPKARSRLPARRCGRSAN